jgi:hypothetical protein
MKNNTSTTDFSDECMMDDFPYRVINPYVVSVSSVLDYYPRYRTDAEEEYDRFDILDIRPKKIKVKGITIEKIERRFKKLKEEIDSDSVWMYSEPKAKTPMSEDSLIKLMEQDLKDRIEESIMKFQEKKQINDRWEIIDL